MSLILGNAHWSTQGKLASWVQLTLKKIKDIYTYTHTERKQQLTARVREREKRD